MTFSDSFRVMPIDFPNMEVTRGALCLAIIDKYRKENLIHRFKKLDEHEILHSDNLAVAMEYLGMLHDKAMQVYAKSRDGFVDLGQVSMSLRDYLATIQ